MYFYFRSKLSSSTRGDVEKTLSWICFFPKRFAMFEMFPHNQPIINLLFEGYPKLPYFFHLSLLGGTLRDSQHLDHLCFDWITRIPQIPFQSGKFAWKTHGFLGHHWPPSGCVTTPSWKPSPKRYPYARGQAPLRWYVLSYEVERCGQVRWLSIDIGSSSRFQVNDG